MEPTSNTILPLLKRVCVEEWRGFADFLCSLGIETSANALELRHRRHGLPAHGGVTRGSRVYFTPEDQDAWVRHLRGMSLGRWIDHQERRSREGIRLDSAPPGRCAPPALKGIPAFDLYVCTLDRPPSGEQILRDERGRPYASRDPAVFESLAAMTASDPPDYRAWRYSGMRRARSAELRGPSGRWRLRSRRQAGRVVAATVRVGMALRWCEVPGALLGARHCPLVPFLTSWGLPTYTDAVRWVQAHVSDVCFVVWPKRLEIEPFALEELPALLSD